VVHAKFAVELREAGVVNLNQFEIKAKLLDDGVVTSVEVPFKEEMCVKVSEASGEEEVEELDLLNAL